MKVIDEVNLLVKQADFPGSAYYKNPSLWDFICHPIQSMYDKGAYNFKQKQYDERRAAERDAKAKAEASAKAKTDAQANARYYRQNQDIGLAQSISNAYKRSIPGLTKPKFVRGGQVVAQ